MIQKFTIWNLSPRERFCREESLFSGEVPKCKFHFPLSLGKKKVLHFGIKDFSQGKEERSFTFWNNFPREGRKKEVLHFGIKDFSQGRKKFYILELRKKFYILELKTSPREGRSFKIKEVLHFGIKDFSQGRKEERSFTFWN